MTEPSVVEVTPDRFADIAPKVARIDASIRAAAGHPALGDAVWRDLERPGPDSAGFLAGDEAYAHIARADNGDDHDWVLGLAVGPQEDRNGTRAALVRAAAQYARTRGGGCISLWLLDADAEGNADGELTAAGMRADRELYEMRVALPLGIEMHWPSGITVRTFEPGRDEDAWLAVNNRAFAGHAEQGGWTRATLARREAEPWFDPALFLLAFDAEGLAGFNWLKIHAAGESDPALGEIYVIGVDPRMQGARLGPALAIAGLDAVAARGIGTGMLFVAADNEPALKLYRSLGFTVHRVDRAYELEVT